MKSSPTREKRPFGSKTRAPSRSVAIAEARRGKLPALFVHVEWPGAYGGRRMVRAHLRNHRGYLELCWRVGKTVKTVHLGKAAKHSPTRRPGPGGPRGPGPARQVRIPAAAL
jgi:hypothetical protein